MVLWGSEEFFRGSQTSSKLLKNSGEQVSLSQCGSKGIQDLGSVQYLLLYQETKYDFKQSHSTVRENTDEAVNRLLLLAVESFQSETLLLLGGIPCITDTDMHPFLPQSSLQIPKNKTGSLGSVQRLQVQERKSQEQLRPSNFSSRIRRGARCGRKVLSSENSRNK